MKKKFFPAIILVVLIIIISGYFFINQNGSLTSAQNETDNVAAVTDTPEEVKQTEAEPVETTEKIITINSVGDITLGTDDSFSKSTSLPTIYTKSNDENYFFKNMSSLFMKDDLTTGNLETTFTDSDNIREKTYNFKGDPTLAKSLVTGGLEAVNISNNHIYDYSQEGFNDTISTLNNYKINYFGEGNVWRTTINGIDFGFLGYQGFNSSKAFMVKLKKDITALKAENRIVIINFHWGEERATSPNTTQTTIAHYAVDNGADLIIGHHPHVIQGVEKYKDKYIAYSLGNFCFGGNSNPSDKDTFILQSKFTIKDGALSSITINAIPCSISSVNYKNDYSPIILQGTEKSRVLEKINKLCINLNEKLTSIE